MRYKISDIKKLVFALPLFFYLLNSAQQVKVSRGKSFALGYQYSFDTYDALVADGANRFLYEYHNNKLVTVNASGDVIAETSPDVAGKNSKAGVEKAFGLKGKMYLILSEPSGDKTSLVCYELSKDGKLSTAPVAAFSTALNEEISIEYAPKFTSMKIGGKLSIRVSDDESKVGVFYLELGKLKEDVKASVVMLDGNFNKLWSNKLTLPLKYWWVPPVRTAIESFRIDNAGNACAMVASAKNDNYSVRALHAVVINSKGTVFKNTLPVSSSKFVISADADFDQKGNVLLVASLSTPEKGLGYGLKVVKFSTDSGKAEFTKDISYTKVKVAFDKNRNFYEFDYYFIEAVRLTQRGDIYIAEEQRIYDPASELANTQATYVQSVIKERMNVLYHHLSDSGTLVQTTDIQKHQMTERANLCVINEDGSCNYVYHYGDTNNTAKFDTENGLYSVKIDASGILEKQLVEKPDGEGFSEGVCTFSDNKHLMYFSGNSKKRTFFSLTF